MPKVKSLLSKRNFKIISELEIKDWLTSPVTQAYSKEVKARILECRDRLEQISTDQLQFTQGYLQAFYDVLEFLKEGKA